MKCQKGTSTVEFVLTFPWILLCLLAVIFLALTVLKTHWHFYSAYKKGRAARAQMLSQKHVTTGHLNDQGYPEHDNWVGDFK